MIQFQSKSDTLYQEIRRRIEVGELLPGARLATTTELMAEFGVAKETVNQAMKKLMAADLIIRIRGVGSCVRSDVASAIRQNVIGFYLPLPGRDYASPPPDQLPEWSDIFAGAAQAAAARGYQLTLIPNLGEGIEADLRYYQAGNVIIHGGSHGFFESFLLSGLQHKYRYMMLNRAADFTAINYLEESSVAELSAVFMRLAESYGHRRTAVVGTDRDAFDYNRHYEAHRDVFSRYGTYHPGLQKRIPESLEQKHFDRAIRELLALPELPTLIFVFRSRFIPGVMRSLSEAGIRVPEEISVVSCDNAGIGQFDWLGRRVDHYLFPRKQRFGARVVELLIDIIEKKLSEPVNQGLPLEYRGGDTLRKISENNQEETKE